MAMAVLVTELHWLSLRLRVGVTLLQVLPVEDAEREGLREEEGHPVGDREAEMQDVEL